jgi:hypothetical protein
MACNTPSDCATASAPYDADNYNCTGNICRYTGCNSTAECQTLGNYVCGTLPGYTVQMCWVYCQTPGDCNMGSAPYDADNYNCTSNMCEYTGCNSTAECQTLGNYVCGTLPGSTLPLCVMACNVPADCNMGSAPYDADNYDCTSNMCEYTGCNSTAECQTLGNYVCQ